MMEVCRVPYKESEYQKICDFFIKLNEEKQYMNWNYARFEWGFFHPEADAELVSRIGIWKSGEEVVGLAVYDMYLGEGFCGTLKEYEDLLPEIYEYAKENLMDENGIGIAVNDSHTGKIELLSRMGFEKDEQTETILRLSLEQKLETSFPENYQIHEVSLPEEKEKYQFLIWRGFDHDGADKGGFEDYYHDIKSQYPHMNSRYTLVAVDQSGEYVAHCGCWYDATTDYVYIEPVCVVPEHRKEGLGRALLFEALNRCREDGAKEAFVLSEMDFYRNMGFEVFSKHTFYWKK